MKQRMFSLFRIVTVTAPIVFAAAPDHAGATLDLTDGGTHSANYLVDG